MKKRFPQAVALIDEQRAGALDVPNRPRQVITPYLNSREAVVYLALPSLKSLYAHIEKNRLPVLRAGGDYRFDVRELDAWLRGFGSAVEQRRSHGRHPRSANTSTVIPISGARS